GISPASGHAPAAAETIVVGAVGSLTGPEAHFGLDTRDGVALAIDEANAAGGVGGRKLVLRSYDAQSKPEEAANAAMRLVMQDRVALVIGENASSNTLAMAPAVARAQVPLISPSATNPRVTSEGGPFVFRVCFVDTFQGEAMAAFARRNLGLGRVAVLTDLKSDYSIGLADVFRRRFRELGGQVISEESYAKGDTDFRALLTRVKARRPEAIFIPGYYSDAGPIAHQARELGIQALLLGGDGWESGGKLVELGGSAVEGAYYSTHFSPDNPSPVVQSFIGRYRARYGKLPDSLGALGYDAARVGIDALRRSAGPGGPALRDAIAATHDFEGVTGRISFGPDRNAVKSTVVVRLAEGKPVFVAEVSP
ncbi:MAG TPA: ABC transporter substrate-binding protein, partial [Myxococcaceae bacterium]|nr:ABC transporter substrate-binding protein [Myxococcaceae bacterium]